MFKKRSDGVYAKNIDPFMRITPYIMLNRNDAMVLTDVKLDCAPLDAFIKQRAALDEGYTYIDLIMTAVVRTMHSFPDLNRFIMNGRIYNRKSIGASVAVHRSLREGDTESTVKVEFTGNETVKEVKEKFDKAVNDEIFGEAANETDKTAKIIMKLPGWLIKFFIKFVAWMDRHNILPKSLIGVSPFHTTFWITNLKSLGVPTVYHHIYNFGTTSHFVSLGKESYVATVVGRNRVNIRKELDLGIVLDERICDGLYYARAIRYMKKLLADPQQLENLPE